jgi:hypothetical protein
MTTIRAIATILPVLLAAGFLSARAVAEPATGADITTWKAITLGTFKSVNVLREALDTWHCGIPGATVQARSAHGPKPPRCVLGDWAAEIIGRPAFVLSKTPATVSLVVVSVAQLGFEDEASLADIYARAKQLGLDLCPAEVGPQLRLQYLDQPVGEFLHIAMEPVARYGGEPVWLTVANAGAGLALMGGEARPGLILQPTTRLVFARPYRVALPASP